MIEIGNRPILWHIMRWYGRFGFRRFVICSGFRSEVIKDYFLNYAAMNSDFTVALLLARGASVLAHDPVAADRFARALGPAAAGVRFVTDWQAHLAAADIVIVATRWPEYRALAEAGLAGKIVFDARRMFAPAELDAARYLSIGRRVA